MRMLNMNLNIFRIFWQDQAPSQQQNQQPVSTSLALNTTHAFNANDPPGSSRFLCLVLPELPSDINNMAVSTPQPIMRRQHQHTPKSVTPLSLPPHLQPIF